MLYSERATGFLLSVIVDPKAKEMDENDPQTQKLMHKVNHGGLQEGGCTGFEPQDPSPIKLDVKVTVCLSFLENSTPLLYSFQ